MTMTDPLRAAAQAVVIEEHNGDRDCTEPDCKVTALRDALAADPTRPGLDDLLLGMVRTSWPMDRDAYEKGWNEAIHAVRARLTEDRP